MPRKSLILAKTKLRNNRRLIKHEDHTYSTKAHKIAPRKIKLYADCEIPSNEGDNSNNEVFEEIITFDKDATIMLPDQEYIQNHSISHDNSFLLKLRTWATSFNVKHSALSKLLKILAKDAHLSVPMDVRTLLSTPLSTELRHIKTIDNGKYIHFGVRNGLECFLDYLQKKSVLYTDVSILRMSFNIDGASISASGGSSFWLILGCVQNLLHIIKPAPVFAVGIFMAFGKPDNFNNFLENFVTEMESLLKCGLIHNSRSYQIKFHACVCDASMELIKGHGGYYCCLKCFTKGVSTTSRNGI